MDRLFLDANVLFSAAYRKEARLGRLWELEDVRRLSSRYAIEEARRNLRGADRIRRLEAYIGGLELVPSLPDLPLPRAVRLPEKDRPILLAALHAGATHLLTGDITHFGPYLGKTVEGMLVLTPGRYLAGRAKGP